MISWVRDCAVYAEIDVVVNVTNQPSLTVDCRFTAHILRHCHLQMEQKRIVGNVYNRIMPLLLVLSRKPCIDNVTKYPTFKTSPDVDTLTSSLPEVFSAWSVATLLAWTMLSQHRGCDDCSKSRIRIVIWICVQFSTFQRLAYLFIFYFEINSF